MSDDFYTARDRVMKTHASRPTAQRPKRPISGALQIVVGAVWGIAFMTCVMFLNANFDRFRQAFQEQTEMASVGAGIMLFLALSIILLAIGLLRRFFFASFRARRGWSLFVGFFLGWAVASLAGRLTAAS